mmetsp:Transcript_13590/g.39161  ORF Transcript_13590/g.39161 Transcript_13590/m.39161 type:complete len:452 (-) Transcript_13590:2683-4038(-)
MGSTMKPIVVWVPIAFATESRSKYSRVNTTVTKASKAHQKKASPVSSHAFVCAQLSGDASGWMTMTNTETMMNIPMNIQRNCAGTELVGSSNSKWIRCLQLKGPASSSSLSASSFSSMPVPWKRSFESWLWERKVFMLCSSASANLFSFSTCAGTALCSLTSIWCSRGLGGSLPALRSGGWSTAHTTSQKLMPFSLRFPPLRQSANHNISTAFSSVKSGATCISISEVKVFVMLYLASEGAEPSLIISAKPCNNCQSCSRILAKREVKPRNLSTSNFFVSSVHSVMRASISSGSSLWENTEVSVSASSVRSKEPDLSSSASSKHLVNCSTWALPKRSMAASCARSKNSCIDKPGESVKDSGVLKMPANMSASTTRSGGNLASSGTTPAPASWPSPQGMELLLVGGAKPSSRSCPLWPLGSGFLATGPASQKVAKAVLTSCCSVGGIGGKVD